MRCAIEYLENRLLASSVPPGSQVLIQGPDHITAGQTVPRIASKSTLLTFSS